jgi:hypothetical protein
MNINNLTIGQAKELVDMIGRCEDTNAHPFKIGEAYLFRTVTYIDVGRVVAITGKFLTLADASWIADTGRYADCLTSGVFDEIEPYPGFAYLNIETIVDAAPWQHILPSAQK